MTKYLSNIAGVVLGVCFLMASGAFFLRLGPVPQFPEGSPIAHFMAATIPTGFIKFVKCFELIGAILVMVPRLRNIGLLFLFPIIVNILAFHLLIDDPKHLLNPMIVVIVICALYLLGKARGKLAGLLN